MAALRAGGSGRAGCIRPYSRWPNFSNGNANIEVRRLLSRTPANPVPQADRCSYALSSADLTEVSEVEGDEDVVDLAGDVAFQHRMISGLESPFLGAAFGVGAAAWV